MDRAILRCHYRGRLDVDPADAHALLDECAASAQALIEGGQLMTAALFHYGRQLFLYYECIGDFLPPESFMGALHPVLSQWPEKDETCDWAKMYHIYWHCEPQGEADWARTVKPERRRGRIALLKPETMFRYVYHHYAIVEEGALKGDKYMSIALHEDLLFSYFEEPRGSINILRDPEAESAAIQGWMDVDPDSHFLHLPGSNGSNFLLLPEIFALGQ